MTDDTQTPGAEPQGTGQENSMGGASEWSTVPPVQPPTPPAQPPSPPAQSLEPLPPAPPPPANPPASGAGGYQPVYGSQQQTPPPPPSDAYGSAPGGGYPPPPPQGPPPGYAGGPGPQYPPPPPPPAAGQGLSGTAAAAISYITFIPAVLFLVMEPYNRDRFVRFHAWQSIALWIVWFAVKILFRVFALAGLHFILFGVGTLIFFVIGMILFIFGLIAMIKASQGQWYKIPVVGDLAASFAGGQK